MTHLRIDNARVIDPANKLDERRTLFISDGVFVDQFDREQCDDDAQVIDAKGLIACPGFIDMYARLREPGFTRKGTIASESTAALKAGFTTVFCAPDTHPVIDSSATVELIKQKAVAANGARVSPIAAFTAGLEGKLLSELATLYNAGCLIAGHADHPVTDTGVLLSTMEYASSFNIPLMIRPFDPAIASGGCAHDGAIATRLGLPGIPVAAETVALARLIELCTSTGCHLHISRLSSARAIELLRSAKKKGLPITADVGIHHLYFTDEQIKHYDANYHSAVPFRSVDDRAALRDALRDGTLDAICSDHAPHDNDAKLAPFPSSATGLSAFDAFAPLLFGLPDLLDMPLIDVIGKVTCEPAAIVAPKEVVPNNDKLAAIQTDLLDARSYSLAVGSQADLVLIDPQAHANLSAENMISLGKNSPLAGVTSLTEITGEDVALRGQVIHSIIAGRLRA